MMVATIEAPNQRILMQDYRFGRRRPVASAEELYERLYQLIEEGNFTHPTRWSGELIQTVRELQLLAPPQSERPDVPQELEDDLASTVEAYANDPRNHQQDAETTAQEKGTGEVLSQALLEDLYREVERYADHARDPQHVARKVTPAAEQRKELSPLTSAYIRGKLHPSLRTFASEYLLADERVRDQTKKLALDEHELLRRQYTVAEVNEMLKMFIRLDRLAYLDRVVAEERRRENAKFHNNLADASLLRRQMENYAKQLAKDQQRYNDIRNRLRLRLHRNEVDRHEVDRNNEKNTKVDYSYMRTYLKEQFERAVKEVKEKGDWNQPTSSPEMKKLLNSKQTRKMAEQKFGVKISGEQSSRLNKIAKITFNQLMERYADQHSVRHPKTGEYYNFDLVTSERYAERAARVFEQVM